MDINNTPSITKYKGATILKTPTTKYPDMLQLIKTSKGLNRLLGKRFININKVMTTIDAEIIEQSIERNKTKSYKELQAVGLSPLDQFQ